MLRRIKTTRADVALTHRLEKVIQEGMAHISREELRRWYDVARLKDGTYRDVWSRWWDLSNGELGELKQVESKTGFFLFAETRVSVFGTKPEK
jgi:hypothetical protein